MLDTDPPERTMPTSPHMTFTGLAISVLAVTLWRGVQGPSVWSPWR